MVTGVDWSLLPACYEIRAEAAENEEILRILSALSAASSWKI